MNSKNNNTKIKNKNKNNCNSSLTEEYYVFKL